MIEGALDLASWALIVIGGAICIIGAFGTLRLSDTYTRMHAAGLIDTGGTMAILAGLMIQAGLGLVTIKLVILIAFLLFTSPTTTHALARALIHAGIQPRVDEAGEPAAATGSAPPPRHDR